MIALSLLSVPSYVFSIYHLPFLKFFTVLFHFKRKNGFNCHYNFWYYSSVLMTLVTILLMIKTMLTIQSLAPEDLFSSYTHYSCCSCNSVSALFAILKAALSFFNCSSLTLSFSDSKALNLESASNLFL